MAKKKTKKGVKPKRVKPKTVKVLKVEKVDPDTHILGMEIEVQGLTDVLPEDPPPNEPLALDAPEFPSPAHESWAALLKRWF